MDDILFANQVLAGLSNPDRGIFAYCTSKKAGKRDTNKNATLKEEEKLQKDNEATSKKLVEPKHKEEVKITQRKTNNEENATKKQFEFEDRVQFNLGKIEELIRGGATRGATIAFEAIKHLTTTGAVKHDVQQHEAEAENEDIGAGLPWEPTTPPST